MNLRALEQFDIRRLATDSRHVKRGDVVLVAGKGHETYQEVGGVRRPFSDVEVARTALKEWAA